MFLDYYQINKNIALRKLQYSDAKEITQIRKTNRNYLPFLSWIKTLEFTEAESLMYVDGKLKNWYLGYEWTYSILYNDTIVGDFQIRITSNHNEIELGYWIDYKHRSQGIMSIIIEYLCQIAKYEGIKYVIIVADPLNIASVNLALKLGFKKTKYWIRKEDKDNGLLTFVRKI